MLARGFSTPPRPLRSCTPFAGGAPVASRSYTVRRVRRGMALIYNATMKPGKLELLTAWLPAQPWYLHPGHEPALSKVGGFRLDDPGGQVGIEFMMVADRAGNTDSVYHVPLTYRGAALAGTNAGLIGTAEHGVLGRRWIYDGVYDPVLLTQLVALIQGYAQAQAQSVSNTADPTVTNHPVTQGSLTSARSAIVANRQSGTHLRIETRTGRRPAGELLLRMRRILQPGDNAGPSDAGQPCLSAWWRLYEADTRSVLVTANYSRR